METRFNRKEGQPLSRIFGTGREHEGYQKDRRRKEGYIFKLASQKQEGS